MEIFLLLLVIVLLFVLRNNQKSEIDKLYKKLHDLDKTIQKIQLPIVVKEDVKPITYQLKTEAKPIEITPPISVLKKEVLPFIATEKETFPIITEPKKEGILVTDEDVINIHKEVFKHDKIYYPQEPITKKESELSWWGKFKIANPDLEKFIGENLISKIGVAILVLGIGFFVKYAIDQNWINETTRAGIGILCGGIVLGFAHKLRKNFKAFSSVLAAGAIAIFYFTIAIAFHQYHLFSQTVAFSTMIVITAFSILISVSYNRIELAALSLIGGFAAPFMVSTGEGSYIALFTYTMILNSGMLVLAYLRKWNLINILTYIFTVLLYGVWLATKVIGFSDAPYKGALIFGSLFYLSFIVMNVINNIKEKKTFSGVELSILLSNTFLFYGAGMAVFQYHHPELKGLFTILLAAFNFVCSWLLYKNFKADKKLIYLMIGLTLTFVTLAAPVQLKGNYITMFWAAEAVLLIWLSQRTKTKSFKFASIIVQTLMLCSLLMDWQQVYGTENFFPKVLLNKGFITGITSALSLLIGVFLFKKETQNITIKYITIEFHPQKYAGLLLISTIVITYLTGFLELQYQTHQYLASNDAANTIVAFYHVAFCCVLSFFFVKTSKPQNIGFATFLISANIALFILLFSIYPYTELRNKIELICNSNTAFFFHYFILTFIIYSCMLLQKIFKKQTSFLATIRRPYIWMLSVFILYFLSNELLLHGLYFMTSPIKTNKPEDYLASYNMWNNALTTVLKSGFPILWGLTAFSFLALGIKKQSKDLRVFSLVLLALTIVKLFIYDIKNVSEAGKIIAFIILGVVLLTMSFMYQKIKAIILQDEQNSKAQTSSGKNI